MNPLPRSIISGAAMLLLPLIAATVVRAELVRPSASGPVDVVAELITLWSAEDHDALAASLATDGADITLARDERAARRTSPAQAHYLFKSLFQATSDHGLEVDSLTVAEDGDSAHAVLDWRFRHAGSLARERLFLTLIRDDDQWRIATLRTGH